MTPRADDLADRHCAGLTQRVSATGRFRIPLLSARGGVGARIASSAFDSAATVAIAAGFSL
jgi:hypothetical protein